MSGQGDIGDRLGGPRLWLLLRLSRWALTAAVLSLVFIVIVAASFLDLTPLRTIVEANDGLQFLFSAFIGAIITGTSIVVTINQLVLSQELGAVGQQRERMQESMSFRRDTEESLGMGASPPEPAAFLYELVHGVEQGSRDLREQVGQLDAGARDAVEEYLDGLIDNAASVTDGLDSAQFGTFAVIWSALQFNYSRKIYDGRALRAEHDLPDAIDNELEEILDTLRFFGPAREHFKTLYFQWELINLSRALLYVSVPALATMGVLIMYVDETTVPGTVAGIDYLVLVTAAGFTVGIAPFVIFIVYILRIATVAKRTLAMGPFILRESERDQD